MDDFVRPSERSKWRDDEKKSDKKERSSGISAKSFHAANETFMSGPTSSFEKQADDVNNIAAERSLSKKRTKHMIQEARKLAKSYEKSIMNSSLRTQFQSFCYVSYYQQFPIQEPAFKALDELLISSSKSNWHSKNGILEDSLMWSVSPRIFAIETSNTGKRKYIVCHLGQFMHRYWRHRLPHARHHYELIRESEPCRLYFDIEYNKKANPILSNNPSLEYKLMEEFKQELRYEIKKQFDLNLGSEHIIDLDSSTDAKFSRHIIVHMPNGALFRNAMDCGVFVKNFVGRLVEDSVAINGGDRYKKRSALRENIFVYSKPTKKDNISDDNNKEEGEDRREESPSGKNKTLFVDLGVYTRNRLFRLLGSSKFGKPPSAALRISTSNTFPFPQEFTNDKFYAPAMSQSIQEKMDKESKSNTNFDELYHEDIDSDDDTKTHIEWEPFATALEQTLITPVKCGNVFLDVGNICDSHPHNVSLLKNTTTKSSLNTTTIINRKTYKNNIGKSPFPPLERFISASLANRKGHNGEIRAWTIDGTCEEGEVIRGKGTIIFQMKGNRWCEHIQRSHKSNNIYWNICLDDMTYWQSCHDPECRLAGFRGEVNTLPQKVQDEVREIAFENSIQIDDAFEAELASMDLP